MRKLLEFLFFIVYGVIVLVFLGAILATVVNPQFAWPFAFLGLGYPVLFIALFLYTIILLFRKKKRIVYPAILLLIGLIALPNVFNFHFGSTKKEAKANELKILNYNVRNFEHYDKTSGAEKRDKIIALIKDESPDILCLQEAYQHPKHILFNSFSSKVDLSNYHFEVGVTAKSGGQFGVAVFSKYPIVESRSYPFGSGGNVGTQVILDVKGDTISVFNIHLESANIENSYYNYSNQDIDDISQKEYSQRTKRVAMQLRDAYMKRSDQAKQIRKEINETSYPVIVCGDFNDTPVSFAYSKVKGGMQDTFKKGGFGLGNTYPAIPIVRIDHVFASNDFSVNSYQIKKEKISDHYPIVTTLELKE